MTVQELIAELSKYSPKAQVYIDMKDEAYLLLQNVDFDRLSAIRPLFDESDDELVVILQSE